MAATLEDEVITANCDLDIGKRYRQTIFDFARHRRVLNLAANYVRLNEFPEWFTVDENKLYEITGPGPARIRLGSELMEGLPLTAGIWEIAPHEGK